MAEVGEGMGGLGLDGDADGLEDVFAGLCCGGGEFGAEEGSGF